MKDYLSHNIHDYKHIPGVIQLESNLSSFGRTWPFSKALRMFCSASLADLQFKPEKKTLADKITSKFANIHVLCTNMYT